MPGVYQQSVDQIVEECREVAALGISAVILSACPNKRRHRREFALRIRRRTARRRRHKKSQAHLLVITDVCLCNTPTTAIARNRKRRSCKRRHARDLAEQALSHARAGADIVAPSDMMDGRVAAVRKKLDENSFADIAILSYAAKYSSPSTAHFAKPRIHSAVRRPSQLSDGPANVREALKEVALDLEEGADMVNVKPALPYLDVIRAVRERFDVPVAPTT